MAGRGWVVRCTGGLWALDRSSHPPKGARDLGSLWESNIGMIAMTLAFAVAGISQVYLERKVGMDFIVVQKEIEVHFIGLLIAASLFTLGIVCFIYNFIRYGAPVGTVGSGHSAEMAEPPALAASAE